MSESSKTNFWTSIVQHLYEQTSAFYFRSNPNNIRTVLGVLTVHDMDSQYIDLERYTERMIFSNMFRKRKTQFAFQWFVMQNCFFPKSIFF